MFFNKNDAYSSFTSSILSCLFVMMFFLVSLTILVPIFNSNQMELSLKSVKLSKEKSRENITCDTCITLTIEDAINLIDGHQYVIYESDKPLQNCSNPKYEFFFKTELSFESDIKIEPELFSYFGYYCNYRINATKIID